LFERLVTDRANVSEKVLDEHYDKRTEEGKRELRRGSISPEFLPSQT
jgi:hypothetical protein